VSIDTEMYDVRRGRRATCHDVPTIPFVRSLLFAKQPGARHERRHGLRPWAHITTIHSDAMSSYVLLFRNPPSVATSATTEQQVHKWAAWIKSLGAAGRLKDPGYPLIGKGKVVSGRKKVVSDGPLSSKGILGGFMIIDARDFDHATSIALNCPVFETGGSVEIRPVGADAVIFAGRDT